MDMTVSLVLAIFSAVFALWLNGKQHEFDELQDQPK